MKERTITKTLFSPSSPPRGTHQTDDEHDTEGDGYAPTLHSLSTISGEESATVTGITVPDRTMRPEPSQVDTVFVNKPTHDTTIPNPPLAHEAQLLNQDLIGAVIAGRYRIQEKLGHGGMAEVYLARHLELQKTVAVKFIRRELCEDETVRKRFHREALTAAAIGNPHIVTIHDYGVTDEGRAFLVMEHMQGNDLRRILKREGPFPIRRAIALTKQVLDGLSAAHQKGVLHRDLKAENIFVSVREGKEFATILDFGLAKVIHDAAATKAPIDNTLTATGLLVGTPQYIAPEQAEDRRPVDQRVDLYAVGILLYEMVTGLRPFEGKTPLEILRKQISEQPRLPSDLDLEIHIPQKLEAIILTALKKDPNERFASALDMIHALDAVGETSEPSQHSVYPSQASSQPLTAQADLLDSETTLDLKRPKSSTVARWIAVIIIVAAAFVLGAILF